MKTQIITPAHWRPVAYVAVRDPARRAEIADALHRQGWAAVEQPSGFHLLRSISEIIEGHRSWVRPGMIVVDAWSHGCSGVSIAAGLRELGVAIPIVLVKQPDDPIPLSPDGAVHIVDATDARTAIAAVAHRWSPLRELGRGTPPERATA